MIVVAEHLEDLLKKAGYPCEVTHQSLWDHPTPPRSTDLILELLPAFTEAEAGCPVLSVRQLLRDLDDPQTIEKIFEKVRATYPATSVGTVAKLSMVI